MIASGLAFAVIFASGFAEVGEDGAAAQQRLLAAIEGSDTHVLGPNTNLNAFEVFRSDLDGRRLDARRTGGRLSAQKALGGPDNPGGVIVMALLAGLMIFLPLSSAGDPNEPAPPTAMM